MKTSDAARIFTALGSDKRLAVFRLLVQAGPDGMAATAIASRLRIAPTTLSFHLKELANTGLVSAQPQGRFIFYTANFPRMDKLLKFLTENCCKGAACDVSR